MQADDQFEDSAAETADLIEDEMPYSSFRSGPRPIYQNPVFLLTVGMSVLIIVLIMVARTAPRGDGVARAGIAGERLDLIERRILRLENLIDAKEPAGDLQAGGGLMQEVEQLRARLDKMENLIEARPYTAAVSSSAGQGSSAATAATATAHSSRPAAGAGTRYHEVKKGDTLYGISNKYGIPVATLLEINNLKDNARIFPGDRLRLTR